MQLKSDPAHYQVVILGGGPAGSACAIALARKGIQEILLVEAGAYDPFCIGESIPPETRPLFIQLGIFEKFLAEGHDPCYGSRSYWGDDRRGHNDSLFSVYGHGWHLDRSRFNHFIAHEAQAAGATLVTRSLFRQCKELDDGRFQLGIKTEHDQLVNITANFVVDATGNQGVFARQQGSKKIIDRPLIALGVRFSLKNSPQAIAQVTHLEAVEYGWWYAASLPNDTLLVMLTTDAQTLKAMNLRQPETWFNLLENTPNTGKWIAHAEKIDVSPRSFPAPSFKLDKILGRNWIAIGDAASAYDPIMSQGIIKALSDGILGAETIVLYLHHQENKFEVFEQAISARYQQYVNMRKYFYQLENRWSNSLFWQKYQA